MRNRQNARPIALILALTIFALAALSGCTQKPAAQQPAPASGQAEAAQPAATEQQPPAQSDEWYVYIAIVTQVPFWADAKRAMEDFARDRGVKATFEGPTTADPQAQAAQLDQIIARKPAGILVFPPDDKSLIAGIDRAVEAGIPVVTMIGDMPDSKRMMHIGIDNYRAGQEGAKLLCEAVGGKGKVVVGTFQAAGVLERVRGYQDWLSANCPGVEVVEVVDDRADPSYAPQAYAAAIARYPDLAGIGGTDGDSGAGAARAVVEAGKKGQIQIVAMDRNNDMLQYIADGTIYAAVAQKTYSETYLAAEMLWLMNHDKLPVVKDWRGAGVPVLPENVDTGIIPVTKDNVQHFMTNP